ncbi:MAG: 4-hydroxy-tetrahydrodipicolinate reductase [Phycisphaerae bacterium]|nr:4-hydroxy-tetrahydrodipicolinate reductase [Phycisphaerae bacterium]
MSAALRLAVAGAAGRMGTRIIALASADPAFRLGAALESAQSSALGRDAGAIAGVGSLNVPVSAELAVDFDVLLDFSSLEGSRRWLDECVRRGRPIVIGVTGLGAAHQTAIDEASRRIAVLQSANTSVGVCLMLKAVEQFASALPASFDVEIIEAHHRMKVDAPSGTALAIRDAVVRGRGGPGGGTVFGREGAAGARPDGEIGMHAIRGGDVVGEHEVRFIGLGETVAVRHSAHSRDTFVRGALHAARWIAGRPAGRYTMADALGAR